MSPLFNLILLLCPLLESLAVAGSPSQISPRKGGGGGGGGGRGGGSSSGRGGSKGSSSSGGKTINSAKLGDKFTGTASSGSRGGGPRVVLSDGSPFSGRLAGGGTREEVYGTSRIGSGYPYDGYGIFYGGRGFPYGFYPVCFYCTSSYPDQNYYGGREYGDSANKTRFGGQLSTAVVQPNIPGNAPTPDSTFYIFGDASSVATVLDGLVRSNCGISNSAVHPAYGNDAGASNPHPEQVVQYYRASSFALALSSYNNSAGLPANAPSNNISAISPMADTPLPQGLNRTLLECINSTIAANVPLLDLKPRLSKDDLGSIILGAIILAAILGLCIYHYGGVLYRSLKKKIPTNRFQARRRSIVDETITHQ